MWRKGFLVAMLLAALGVPGVFHSMGLVWNVTPSLPLGIWKRVDLPGRDLRYEDHVLFCPPPAAIRIASGERRILGWGTCPGGYRPFLKKVLGLPGDEVTAGPHFVLINGRKVENSGVAKPEKGLFPVPSTFKVPDGQLWLMATHSRLSFDSRYFGPVPISQIRGKFVSLWTFHASGWQSQKALKLIKLSN